MALETPGGCWGSPRDPPSEPAFCPLGPSGKEFPWAGAVVGVSFSLGGLRWARVHAQRPNREATWGVIWGPAPPLPEAGQGSIRLVFLGRFGRFYRGWLK